MGVACVVVRDLVTSNSALVESTVDWYAQDRQGNVWYFGEDTKEYTNGAVSSTQGTWEAGVDGALPGIYMKAHPKPGGPAYLQEYRPGVAVDMAKILRVDKTLKVPSGTYRTVVETYDTDPLHPSKREHKSPDLRRWRSCRAQPGRRLSHGRGGAIVAVTGPSGSGKSTLLYLLGGLEDPDAGGGVRIAGTLWRSLRAGAEHGSGAAPAGSSSRDRASCPRLPRPRMSRWPSCSTAWSGTSGTAGSAPPWTGWAWPTPPRSSPTSSPAASSSASLSPARSSATPPSCSPTSPRRASTPPTPRP